MKIDGKIAIITGGASGIGRGLARRFKAEGAAGVVIGGKVPVVITSRSDEAQARLASMAAAVVAL